MLDDDVAARAPDDIAEEEKAHATTAVATGRSPLLDRLALGHDPIERLIGSVARHGRYLLRRKGDADSKRIAGSAQLARCVRS